MLLPVSFYFQTVKLGLVTSDHVVSLVSFFFFSISCIYATGKYGFQCFKD